MKKLTKLGHAPAVSLLGLLGLQSGLVLGQQGSLMLEEVIVTAQKRQERLQDVPVSVSAVSGQQIIDQGLGDLKEMSVYVPNLTINQTPGATLIYIRGLGSGENQGFEQSVGLFVDGVYAGRSPQFRAPFLDVGSVEVLRGPQGTLFGKNTIAGAITINTERPSDEFEAILRTRYDIEYGDYTLEGIVSGSLTDSLAGRVAVRRSDTSGYMDNTFQSRDEADSEDTVLRASLQWEINDNASAFLKYEKSEIDIDGKNIVNTAVGEWLPLIQEADPRYKLADDKRSTSTEEFLESDAQSMTVQFDVALGEFELKSISAYSEYQHKTLADADTTPVDAAAFEPGQDFEQWSQEFRLSSPLGGQFDYIIGAFYLKNELEATRNFGVATANVVGGPDVPPLFGALQPFGFRGDFEQDTESFAVFGSLNWHFADKWQANFGVRYTDESKDADRSLFYTGYLSNTPLDEVYDPPLSALSRLAWQALGVYEHTISGDRDVDNWSPSLRVSYDLTDDIMLYASTSRAFKSGGFNEAGSRGDDPGEFPPGGDPANFEFEDEEALSFELGGKMRLFDQRASLNFAVFRTEFDDLQVSTFQGDSFIVGNAADVTTQGVEVDGTVRLSEAWTLFGSVAYLDAEYDSFKNAPCTVDQVADWEGGGGAMGSCQQDLSGKELPNSPEWSGVLSLAYEQPWRSYVLSGTADLLYTDEQYLAGDLDPHAKEDSSTRVNARIAISDPDKNWELALVGKNLTDETVRIFSNDAFLMTGVYFSRLAPPRTVEAQVNLRW